MEIEEKDFKIFSLNKKLIQLEENVEPDQYGIIKVLIVDDEEKELMGTALIAIMDTYRNHYSTINGLHQHIIEIYKSNLNISEQK